MHNMKRLFFIALATSSLCGKSFGMEPNSIPKHLGLHTAARTGDIATIKDLANDDTINTPDNDGNTPLMIAVKNTEFDVIRQLLKYTAINIDHRNNNHQTALDILCELEMFNIINKLDVILDLVVHTNFATNQLPQVVPTIIIELLNHNSDELKFYSKKILQQLLVKNFRLNPDTLSQDGETIVQNSLGSIAYAEYVRAANQEHRADSLAKLKKRFDEINRIQNEIIKTCAIQNDQSALTILTPLLEELSNFREPNPLEIWYNYDLTPLLQAIRLGNRQVAARLMLFGANINSKNLFGDTLLVTEATEGVQAVKLLIELGATIVEADGNSHALIRATQRANVEILKVLLEKGAPINSQRDEVTTLQKAILYDNMEAVKLLLEHNADVNLKTNLLRTPLELAIGMQNPNVGIITLLLEKKPIVSSKITEKAREIVDSESANPIALQPVAIPHPIPSSLTLHQAVEREDVDSIKRLICDEKHDINAPDGDGNTPLMYAAKNKKFTAMQALLGDEYKDSLVIDHINKQMNTARSMLWTIHQPSETELITMLALSGHQNFRLDALDTYPLVLPPPIMNILQEENPSFRRSLAKEILKNMLVKNYQAFDITWDDVIKKSLGPSAYTLYLNAKSNNKKDNLAELAKRFRAIRELQNNIITACMQIRDNKQPMPDQQYLIQQFKELEKFDEPDIFDAEPFGETAFIIIASSNAKDCNDVLSYLLMDTKIKFNVNARDTHGRTALHWAVLHENIFFMNSLPLLINPKSMNINAQDNEGNTPFHLAIINEQSIPTSILSVNRSTDITIKNAYGETPITLAQALVKKFESQKILGEKDNRLLLTLKELLLRNRQQDHYAAYARAAITAAAVTSKYGDGHDDDIPHQPHHHGISSLMHSPQHGSSDRTSRSAVTKKLAILGGATLGAIALYMGYDWYTQVPKTLSTKQLYKALDHALASKNYAYAYHLATQNPDAFEQLSLAQKTRLQISIDKEENNVAYEAAQSATSWLPAFMRLRSKNTSVNLHYLVSLSNKLAQLDALTNAKN